MARKKSKMNSNQYTAANPLTHSEVLERDQQKPRHVFNDGRRTVIYSHDSREAVKAKYRITERERCETFQHYSNGKEIPPVPKLPDAFSNPKIFVHRGNV